MSLVRFRPEAPWVSRPHGSFIFYADVAHLVERHLAKVEVASSSLVIRSRSNGSEYSEPFFVICGKGDCDETEHDEKSRTSSSGFFEERNKRGGKYLCELRKTQGFLVCLSACTRHGEAKMPVPDRSVRLDRVPCSSIFLLQCYDTRKM